MKFAAIIFVFIIFGVSGQTWVSRARLSNFNLYFRDTAQHLIYELEKKEWCNLKIQDNTVVLDEHMYRWHVTGNVTYANGFLISIQKIDLSKIENLFNSRTENGTAQVTGTVRGLIHLRDATVGFDVTFKPEDGTEQHYTGVYTYRLITFRAAIGKNYHTGEITTTVDLIDLSTGSVRMTFLPANSVTEVLSRRTYTPSSIFSSVVAWGRSTMQPILQELVTTKMEFPSVCFVNC